MKKLKRYLLILLLVLVAGYLLGPKPPKPELNKNLSSPPVSISSLENYIKKKDSEFYVTRNFM